MTKSLFLSIVVCLISFAYASAQTNITISRPQLEFKDNNIIVLYNILNAGDSQSFRVWLDVTDPEGNSIETKALSGDVGNNIEGGAGKRIFWNLTADNIYIDALVSVKINAELIKEDEASVGSETEAGTPAINEYAGISRSGLYLQSVLFPGWGLSRINKGPHWLKGLAAYGCLAGSVIYNTKASSNYQDYRNTDDVIEGNRLYALSTRQDKISEGLAIAAGTIWVTEMIWTIAGSQKVKNSLRASCISIEPSYEPVANAPVIAFKYSF